MKRKATIGIIAIAIVGITIIGFSQFDDKETLPETNDLENEASINKYELLANSANLVNGDLDSKVTIIAFLDYQCTDCKSWFSNTYPEIKEKLVDTGQANLKFVNAENIGEISSLAAESVYCAYDQGKFSEYQEKLFSSQGEIDGNWVEANQLKTYAQEIGLELPEFSNCLDSNKYETKAMKNVKESQELGLEKTPVFIIFSSDGKSHIIKGGVSFGLFESVINRMNN